MIRIIIALSIFLPFSTIAQHSTQKPVSSFNSLISTPQAQQFQRYGEIPVDYSTGIPSITIPLGKLGIKNLDWPLELSYYSGGHKVGDVASNVGLGWTMTGIGMISANIYGKQDTHFPLEEDSIYMRSALDLGASAPQINGCSYQNPAHMYWAEVILLPNGNKNILPDVYHLNIGNRSHKMFVLGDSAYTMPASDLKIKINRTYSGTSITNVSFFIVDEKGTKYYFSIQGQNKQRNYCQGTRFNSSDNNYIFHLDSAVNVFNEKLSFYYSKDTYSYFMPTFRQSFAKAAEAGTPCFNISLPPPVICNPQYLAVEAKVDSIVSSSGDKVVLQYASRTDLPSTGSGETGGSRVNSIKFYHKSDLRFAYDLEQDYFISPSATTAEYYRLRLKSVTLKDKNLASDQKYTLTYNSKQLPERTSYSVDSAGFFNDRSNATNVAEFADRVFDEAATKACILESINYPTGGKSQFDYELNSSGYGGLRIKRITNTPLYGVPEVKKFTYHYIPPTSLSFSDIGQVCAASEFAGGIYCDYWIYQSSPHKQLLYEYEDYYNIKYRQIEEFFGENGENGKNTYRYGHVPDYNYSSTNVPYVLLEKSQFKKTGSLYELVQKETYTYNSFLEPGLSNEMFKKATNTREKRVWGKEITRFSNETNLTIFDYVWCFPQLIGEGSIVLVSNPSLLSDKVTTLYNGTNDSIVTTEKLSYSVTEHLLPVKVETSNSLGEVKYAAYKYPTQYGNLTTTDNLTKGVKNLKDRNIINVVEATNYIMKGATPYLLSGSFNSYKSTDPVLDSTLELYLSTPLIGTSFVSSANTAGKLTRDTRYTPAFIFSRYDTWGNLQERFRYQDTKEVYLWGYASQHPVAKIVGSDYNSAIAQVSQIILNNPTSDLALRTELNKLRTNLTGALVSTYTYNPLYGITSETDPSGRTTYYEYDELGRLKLIRDHDNNIIRHFEYRFQASITQ